MNALTLAVVSILNQAPATDDSALTPPPIIEHQEAAPQPPPPPPLEPAPQPPPQRSLKEALQVPEEGRKLNRISGNVLLAGFGYLPIEYERALSDKTSVALGVQLSYPALGALLGIYSAGVGVTGEYRFFPLDQLAPSGLWLGPQFRADVAGLSGNTGNKVAFSTGLLGMVGYTFIAESGLSISAGAGLGVNYGTAAASLGGQAGASGAAFGLGLGLHTNIGYAF